jgi:decaprenylphospho-beta-D-ribofuranose 2-oxidase
MFVAGLIDAARQGRRWLWTLLWGAVVGFAVEAYLVSDGANGRYDYSWWTFALHAYDVPLCLGAGWGLIFYASGWTAQRLRFGWPLTTAFVAGILGVNLDLSLDPVANMNELWVWKPLRVGSDDLHRAVFGVPFDNFIAWVAIIGMYSGSVRALYRWLNGLRYGKEKKGPPGGAAQVRGSFWNELVDFFVPVLAAAPGAWAFVKIRKHAAAGYEFFGMGNGQSAGEAFVFGLLFLGGMGLFWFKLFRATRDEEPNRFILITVAYVHALCFVLFLLAGGLASTHAGLLVMIPTNLVAGFLAFCWPFQDALFNKVVKPLAGDVPRPNISYRTLSSYSGAKVRALVWAPTTEQELRAALSYAEATGKSVTFRAGGMAFDTQSLNDHLVISLEALKSVHVDDDPKTPTVTVGAGATWGEILKETKAKGLVPVVMVTTSKATAGGTLSSNSLSRFSATQGREGNHVVSLTLVTPDGRIVKCSPDDDDDFELFRAVIGGLGYVGAILDITYRLLRLPESPMVQTKYRRITGLHAIGKGAAGGSSPRCWPVLAEHAVAQRKVQREAQVEAGHASPAPRAFSVAVNMREGAWGLLGESEYVSRPKAPCKGSVFHQPQSMLHFLLQLAAWVPFLRRFGYWLTYRSYAADEETIHHDELVGYTFFEDGHRRVRGVLQLLFPCPVVQQTYMLPADEKGEALAGFLRAADEQLDGKGLEPTMIDVLYASQDSHPWLLSSNRDSDAFVVTFTFESLIKGLEAEGEALRALSKTCFEHRGWTHLVKNVYADEDLVAVDYRASLDEMRVVRGKSGALGRVYNGFADRVLPTIEVPVAVRESQRVLIRGGLKPGASTSVKASGDDTP